MTDDMTGAAFEDLLALQDLDIAITQAAHRRAALPERAALEAVSAAQEALVSRREAARSEASPLLDQRDALEGKASTLSARRAQLQDRLYSSRGSAARDLAAIDDEVRHITERLTAIEDEELEVMEALEPLEADLAELGTDIDALEVTAALRRTETEAAERVVDEEIAGLRMRREQATRRVPPALSERYERLRARLGGVGVARLESGRCGGCHLALSAMEADQVRHQDPGSVHICEQCGRILVAVSSVGGDTRPGDAAPDPR